MIAKNGETYKGGDVNKICKCRTSENRIDRIGQKIEHKKQKQGKGKEYQTHQHETNLAQEFWLQE